MVGAIECVYENSRGAQILQFFGIVFNKIITPLALVGYEIVIAHLTAIYNCTISYPMHAHGIIVKYTLYLR